MEDTFRVNLTEISDTNLDRLVEILVAWKLYGLPATFYDIDHIEFVVKSGKKYDDVTFITNSDDQMAMLNGGMREEFYTSPYDGHEGFEEDLKAIYHDMHEEDKEWFDSVEDYLRD